MFFRSGAGYPFEDGLYFDFSSILPSPYLVPFLPHEIRFPDNIWNSFAWLEIHSLTLSLRLMHPWHATHRLDSFRS